MIVLYLIVLAITATVIVNTLVMAVFERTREIGILAAVGMKSSWIMAMFFVEFGLAGRGRDRPRAGRGCAAGQLGRQYWHSYRQYGDRPACLIGDRIYAILTLSDSITLSILAFFVSLLAALYPAASGGPHGTGRSAARRAVSDCDE